MLGSQSVKPVMLIIEPDFSNVSGVRTTVETHAGLKQPFAFFSPKTHQKAPPHFQAHSQKPLQGSVPVSS